MGMGSVCTCSTELDYNYVFNDVKVIIYEFYVNGWYTDLNRVNAKHGQGRNKLRTYKLFKQTLETACYFLKVNNRHHLREFARFGCGVAPLAIEPGRFNNISPLANCLFLLFRCIHTFKYL